MTLRITSRVLVCTAALLSASLAPTPAAAGDWPQLLGPDRNGVSAESGLLEAWPPGGPPRLWELRTGETYAAPSIRDGHLVLFHRTGDEEVVDCLDPLDPSKRHWRHAYPTAYVDDYGYNNGPRSTPAIAGSRVITLGAEGVLTALDLDSGKVIWKRSVDSELGVPKNFFGTGATPLVDGGLVIVNAGGPGAGIVAYDEETGAPRWKVSDDGSSYATPIPATIHGDRHVFVFGRGGLHSIDPAAGKERWFIPFRSRTYYSVNAASPAVAGDRVFVSASYNTGGLLLQILPGGGYRELWRSGVLGTHWSTALIHQGCLFGFDGRHESEAILKCVALETGKVRWENAEFGRGSMILAGGRFIILGERGDLALAEASIEAYRETSRVHLLGYPSWTAPVLANGRLYIRDERRLLCLDLRRPGGDPGAGAEKKGGTAGGQAPRRE